MTREDALKKMQAFMDFFHAAKSEIQEAIDALCEPKWVSVKEDLPCNHEELISLDDKRDTLYVVAAIHNFIIMSRMYKEDGKWHWENDEPTHWMPIPKLPKE